MSGRVPHSGVPPTFSIIIPMYNRERLIGRAIESCLRQNFGDFELIVVDDGSKDDSAAAVLRYVDHRIRLMRHERNRGVCPARNTGVDAAVGQWLIFLDSDDELLPGALETIAARAEHILPNVSRMVFMYKLGDGEGASSPSPPLREETWDYEGYIRWVTNVTGASDFCNVIRRPAARAVRFPSGASAETYFHLDFAHRFLTRTFSDVVGIIHSDALNRSTMTSVSQLLGSAPDTARALEELLERHGEALQRLAPTVWRRLASGLAVSLFLAGDRAKGFRAGLRSLRRNPWHPRLWFVMMLGSFGRTPLAWFKNKMRK